jgi:hypothetical protein
MNGFENNLVGGTTKYLGATESKGSRIKVTMYGRSKTFNYNYSAHNAHVDAFLRMVEHQGYIVDSGKPDVFGEYADERAVSFIADSETGKGAIYVARVVVWDGTNTIVTADTPRVSSPGY